MIRRTEGNVQYDNLSIPDAYSTIRVHFSEYIQIYKSQSIPTVRF